MFRVSMNDWMDVRRKREKRKKGSAGDECSMIIYELCSSIHMSLWGSLLCPWIILMPFFCSSRVEMRATHRRRSSTPIRDLEVTSVDDDDLIIMILILNRPSGSFWYLFILESRSTLRGSPRLLCRHEYWDSHKIWVFMKKGKAPGYFTRRSSEGGGWVRYMFRGGCVVLFNSGSPLLSVFFLSLTQSSSGIDKWPVNTTTPQTILFISFLQLLSYSSSLPLVIWSENTCSTGFPEEQEEEEY